MFKQRKAAIYNEDVEAIEEIYGFLEAFLADRQWIALDTVTIADYSLITSVTSLNIFVKIDPVKYPKLNAWIRRVASLPEYEVDAAGLVAFQEYIENILGSSDEK